MSWDAIHHKKNINVSTLLILKNRGGNNRERKNEGEVEMVNASSPLIPLLHHEKQQCISKTKIINLYFPFDFIPASRASISVVE